VRLDDGLYITFPFLVDCVIMKNGCRECRPTAPDRCGR
jgi:hypothetical protein